MQVSVDTRATAQNGATSSSANLLGISMIAALAGFIFGFDTVVISGANQPIKDLWHTSTLFHGFFIMSMALWGTVAGAMLGGWPSQKYGRKKVLLWVGILFSVSAVGSALAGDPYTFSFFRFIGGLGIGVSSVAAPTYVSEISTPSTRGRLVAMYQFNIVFGILVAFVSNYFLNGVCGTHDWRWMLGVMAIPSLIYTVMVFGIPESPRWLVSVKKDDAMARKVMERLGMNNIDEEIKLINASAQHESHAGHESKSFFSSKYKTILWLTFLVAFFNQWSGINFILYYAPEILSQAGLAVPTCSSHLQGSI
jgi:sugar porter (SP) family MFS transporter